MVTITDDDVKLYKYETYMFKEPLVTLKPLKIYWKRSSCELIEELAARDGVNFDGNTILVSTGRPTFFIYFRRIQF